MLSGVSAITSQLLLIRFHAASSSSGVVAVEIASIADFRVAIVTDWSSAAVEFLPFGELIEIGKFPKKNLYEDEEIEPSSSKIVSEVTFINFKELSSQVSKMIEKGAHSRQTTETRSFDDFCFTPSSHSRVFAADIVNSVFLR